MSRSKRLRCFFVGETLRWEEPSLLLERERDLDRDLEDLSVPVADRWDDDSRRRGILGNTLRLITFTTTLALALTCTVEPLVR